MRYERLQDIVRLAIRLQGALGGLTLDDIQDHFRVSRSSAERMRNAVDAAFASRTITVIYRRPCR